MFESFNVNDSFKKSIISALSSGKLSHALIIEGKDDSTRLSVAKEIAKAILCKADEKPCCVCSHCAKCDKGIHPDLYVIEKEEDSTFIKVDSIRSLKAKALVLPNEADKSVFIIREAQNMNVQAQNALLKIFEEPSPHVCFVLTCPSKSAFIDTIISRATTYTIGEEESSCDGDAEKQAAEFANELLTVFVTYNEFFFLQKTSALVKDKQLFRNTLKAMVPIIRDALILSGSGNDLISAFPDTAKRLSSMLTQKKLLEMLEEIMLLSDTVNASANHNLSITRLSSVLYNIKSH